MTVKPSSKMTYALRALVDLALHEGIGPVPVGAIAKRQRIPARYLEQLFHRLKNEALVVAERGPRGGYRLAKPAGKIPVSAIFDCLESSEREEPLQQQGTDPTASLWQQVERAVQTTLEATTLAVLVEQSEVQHPSRPNHPYTFHI